MLPTFEKAFLKHVLQCIFAYAVLLLSPVFSLAQNICPNSSFEYLNPCPSGTGEINNALPWNNPPGSLSTTDLFSSCHQNAMPVSCQDVGVPVNFAGSSTAHTGNGYAGIVTYNSGMVREYLQTPLDSSLDPGVAYRIEAYVRRAGLSRYSVDKMGILLSSGPIYQPGSDPIPLVPQIESASMLDDTLNWSLISGIYIAAGGEDHITIGNFRNNSSTSVYDHGMNGSSCLLNNSNAYYYIDDVRVERIFEKIVISGDNIICIGDNTTLTASANVNVWWSISSSPNDTVGTGTSLFVNPADTTTYILNGLTTSDSITVYIVTPPVVSLGNDTTICEGSSVELNASNPNSTYAWSTGETAAVIFATANQSYWVTADNGGCIASDTMNLTVLPNPPVELEPETTFCPEDPNPLMLDAGSGASYLWLPTGETTKTVLVQGPITYTVTVIHANGCQATAGISISESCPPLIFIPTAFTPNQDGLNDYFIPFLAHTVSFEISIFNKWGNRVYSNDNMRNGWDGTYKNHPAPAGIYVYEIRYHPTEKTQSDEKVVLRGTFLLMR